MRSTARRLPPSGYFFSEPGPGPGSTPGAGARAPASGTKGAQAGTDLADQDPGLFQGREVPALVGLAVVDQVAVGVFDPASWQAGDVPREDGHRDRERQLRSCEGARLVLPVGSGGRSCAVW